MYKLAVDQAPNEVDPPSIGPLYLDKLVDLCTSLISYRLEVIGHEIDLRLACVPVMMSHTESHRISRKLAAAF